MCLGKQENRQNVSFQPQARDSWRFFFLQEQRRKLLEASLLMDNAKHSRKVFGGTLVTSVLAVYLVAGADYSAFVIFLPQVH